MHAGLFIARGCRAIAPARARDERRGLRALTPPISSLPNELSAPRSRVVQDRDRLSNAAPVREEVLVIGRIGGVKARETAALVACARWCYGAASARNESRGMHVRNRCRRRGRALHSARLLVGGLDRVWTRLEQAPAQVEVVQ